MAGLCKNATTNDNNKMTNNGPDQAERKTLNATDINVNTTINKHISATKIIPEQKIKEYKKKNKLFSLYF